MWGVKIGYVTWTDGPAASNTDHSGLTLETGVSEYAGGLSMRRTRGLSGYKNFFISLFEGFVNEFKRWSFRWAS